VIRLTKSKKFCCCLDGCLLFLFNETFTWYDAK
jgi:(2Fe-2S) ferredoxin